MTSTLPPLLQAFSGSVGSALANATSYPLDLVCTRLQTSESREKQGVVTAAQTLKRILDTRGFLGLYDGLETDTVATLLSNFFYFYIYSFLRRSVVHRKSSRIVPDQPKSLAALSAFEEIAVGFLAGVSSRAVSSPFNVVTVRLQTERRAHSGDFDGNSDDGTVLGVFKHIYAERGLKGFWRGFKTASLLCLNPSITLFLFQAFRRIFLRGRDRDQPTPRQAFLGGALSNVIAVTILYPLILAKTRLQSSRKDSQSGARSMIDVWRSAYTRDGLPGLYQGLEAQIMKGFLNQGLTMMTKQRLEQFLYRFRKMDNPKPILYRYVYTILYLK